MSDLIDRGDVLGVISCFFEDSFIEDADVHCAELEREINRLPAAPRWVRCEEGLPNSQELVIVGITDTAGDTPFSYASCGWLTTDKEYWIVDNEICGYVVAWMPLPEPPKEDKNGN